MTAVMILLTPRGLNARVQANKKVICGEIPKLKLKVVKRDREEVVEGE